MEAVVKGLGTDATLNGGCSVQQKEVKFTTPLVILLTHVPPEKDHRNQKSMSGFFSLKTKAMKSANHSIIQKTIII